MTATATAETLSPVAAGTAGQGQQAQGCQPRHKPFLHTVFLLCVKLPPEAGFYYLYDRHSDSRDPYDDSLLHQRYSWNFTAAVYDSGAGRLYYYEFDT